MHSACPQQVRLKVWGDYACFTRAELKVERVSYPVMTPSAARGILEAVHWKPAIRWVIDEIHVLKPIREQSILRNEVGHKVPAGKARTCMNGESIEGLHLLSDADNQQRHTRLLRDVSYVIVAHYEMNGDAYEDDEAKHYDMFTRRARLGQCWQQPCFGMREFIAYFDLVESEAAMPPAIPVTQELGYMLFDVQEGRRPMIFNAVLDNGVLAVPAPDSPEVLK